MAPYVNGPTTYDDANKANVSNGVTPSTCYSSVQEPVAVVGMACRLPDQCHTPYEFWKFLEAGKVAINTPPSTRFSVDNHYDGSLKSRTMASPGGMFLQAVDPRDVDAQFFHLSGTEAASMDPQQRQLLEVVYEGLENAGVTLEQLDGAKVGCFVSSFAVDYGDMQARDPENRAPSSVVGVGRAMLSNRISHFLNIKGPSMTIDTACSGALTALDLAMRYLQTREISSAIVAGANIYCSPEHVMDNMMGANGAASLSGKCHVFDEKADGYIKAEGVNMVYLKLLDDAIPDKDPIRAIIRGSATNSDGWTAGIASPNAAAQSDCILQAYKNAGITDLSKTTYVEMHGTGTRAGDVVEANSVASVFTEWQSPNKPLRIGSVKSNIGHSEPAAGLSALIKTVLSLEKGIIPGNPTFINPTPKIDFEKLRIWTSRITTPWNVSHRRASVNSFGYGGSNAHVVIDEAIGVVQHHVSSYLRDDDLFAESTTKRPYLLTFSASNEKSLDGHLSVLGKHLSDPLVGVHLRDLAYTLNEKRSRHYNRGFFISAETDLDLDRLVRGSARENTPKIGFVFTGQGAQWPEMGKGLLDKFPLAAQTVKYLDEVLQSAFDPPTWTLYDQLVNPCSDKQLRLPQISQPTVTALQLAILAIYKAAGVSCHGVVGHSSGEIAAAVAANLLTPEQAIKIAYYRGKATSAIEYEVPLGMMAAGIGAKAIQPYLNHTSIQIACINSPQSVTLSGNKAELIKVERILKDDGHFARLLQVDAAYHSKHMIPVAEKYRHLLEKHVEWHECAKADGPVMFSSTKGEKVFGDLGPIYWVTNMMSTVLFSQAVNHMITQEKDAVDYMIEIGPSNALSGPIKQIMKASSTTIEYNAAWKRGSADVAVQTLLESAGKLYNTGYPIRLAAFNEDDEANPPLFISDLPNYAWNHSIKYWHESESSVDWRFRKFVYHDLIGSKILGSPWSQPVWKNFLKISEVTWIEDHVVGGGVILPAAGYIAMAIEAIFQKQKATGRLPETTAVDQITYQLRDVTFPHMLSFDKNRGTKVLLALNPCSSTRESWHEFTISSISPDDSGVQEDHCTGLVSIGDHYKPDAPEEDVVDLKQPISGQVWYKALRNIGLNFGSRFHTTLQVESEAHSRKSRTIVNLETPESRYSQSPYPMHPAVIDGCLQATVAGIANGLHSSMKDLTIPALIDNLVIFPRPSGTTRGVASSETMWTGAGRPDDVKRLMSNINVYAEGTKELIFHLKGMRYHVLDAASDSPHAFSQVVWAEDIDFLTPKSLGNLLKGVSTDEEVVSLARVAKLASLVAHKRPTANFLEIVLEDASSSLWIDRLREQAGPIANGCAYRLSLSSENALTQAMEKYSEKSNIDYVVHEGDGPFGGKNEEKHDIILLRTSHITAALKDNLERAQRALTSKGFLVVLQESQPSLQNGIASDEIVIEAITPKNLETIPDISTTGCLRVAYMGVSTVKEDEDPASDKIIHITHFQPSTSSKTSLKDSLFDDGRDVVEHCIPFDSLPPKSTVLVLDEIFSPVISKLSNEQLTALRQLLDKECRVLWLTRGAQMKVTNPELGLIFGTARSLLKEYPMNLFLCLDIEDPTNKSSLTAIHMALEHLNSVKELARSDSEFVERDGLYHVSRVISDDFINKSDQELKEGVALREEIIHNHNSTIRLHSERLGTLDSLVYTEILDLPPLKDDEVEVEVRAAGMNFKDLACAMGVVPANEHMLGFECTGVVREFGKNVTKFNIGDRVVVPNREGGSFANRVRYPAIGVFHLPDWMSFEDGTTLGVAMHTALYCLVNLANVKKGQSVLIHSASGGVGLSAIDICKYLGAEIYVTVGTEGKRDFLEKNYGIPRSRMFSSRTTSFSEEIMKITNGRGVDVCLNSLTGDMLHESWRCIAEDGSLIEIGKKDILDRNSLSMEPFDRNCSYRAFDLSRFTWERISEISKDVLDLIHSRHLRPLHICAVFSFENIVEAFRYMQRGSHIGKVVISFENSKITKVPIRRASQELRLRPDGSYLYAGGIKGMGGSLAVYMACCGAKNIVVISRSGYDDAKSQKVISDCKALGCHVDLVKGSITEIDDVRRAYTTASKPVIGIIHGAAMLRDRPLFSMTLEEFHDPVLPKVKGTWNLHNVAQELGLKLDFFILLSSLSGLLGQPGQANYTTGNVFQDSFATYRLQQGLAANSLNLGPVDEVGWLSSSKVLDRFFESRGWSAIKEKLLHRILRASILQQTHTINPYSTGVMITGFVPEKPPFEAIHRFSALRPAAGSVSARGENLSGGSGRNKLDLLKNAANADIDKDALLAVAIDVMNGVMMRNLGVKEPLDAARPLADYGVDSLTTIELRNWIRVELAIDVSVLESMRARTLKALSETVVNKLLRC